MENTIIQLQEMVSHQSEDIARMSLELYAQQREIASMKSEIDALRKTVKFLKENEGDEPLSLAQEHPPHY